jgi:hypothetical protein
MFHVTALPVLAVSETVWLALIAAVPPLVLAYFQYRTAVGVRTSDKKLDAIASVADVTHSLVNSGMGAQLRLHATTARALANKTKARADLEVAETAERVLREHAAKQASADNLHRTGVAP